MYVFTGVAAAVFPLRGVRGQVLLVPREPRSVFVDLGEVLRAGPLLQVSVLLNATVSSV